MSNLTQRNVFDGTILLSRVPKLEALLFKINKKAESRNHSKITLIKGNKGTTTRILQDQSEIHLDNIRVVIKGSIPKIKDAEVLGFKMMRDGLPIFIGNIPAEFRELDSPKCEHCQTTRNRKNYAVLQNLKTGVIFVVGSSCYKEYAKDVDAIDLASYANYYNQIFTELDLDEIGNGSRSYCPKRVLATTALLLESNQRVFISNSKAIDEGLTPTWYSVRDNYAKLVPSAKHYDIAAKIMTHIDSIDEADTNSYILNVRARINADAVSDQDLPLLISAWMIKERHDRDLLKANLMSKSEYFGEIKERVELELTLIAKHHYESRFGGGTYYCFSTQDGNSCVWKTSSYLRGDYDITETYPGEEDFTHTVNYHSELKDIITVKATISGHEVYNGRNGDIKTTYLTRLKALSFKRDDQIYKLK